MDSSSSPSQSRRTWRRFLGRSATGHPTQQLTPTRPGGKRPTNPVDSATQDSTRGLRIDLRKASRREKVLSLGTNSDAAGVTTSLDAAFADAGQDTPHASGRDATETFDEMRPPPDEEVVAEAYNRIGLGAHVSGAVEAVVNGMKNLWARATRQKARIFKHKAEAECEAWARLDAVDRDAAVLAAKDAANGTKAYLKVVHREVTLRLAEFDTADSDCARFLERAQNAKKATTKTLVLKGGREVRIIKLGKKGKHSVELLGANTDGWGDAGDQIFVSTGELLPGQDNLAPTVDELRLSACGRLGPTVPTKLTPATIVAFRKKLAEARAEATEKAYAAVAGGLYDENDAAFVAACKAARTRTDVLLLIEKRSLELSCLPKRAITQVRCLVIAEQAGDGYHRGTLATADKIPEGLTSTQFHPRAMYAKAQEERNEQPAIDRLLDLLRRRESANIRAAPEREARLFDKMRAKAPIQVALADETCDVGALDECEAAFDRAEATRKGPRSTVASARWCLPLCSSIKLEASADDLRQCPEFLIPFDEDDFDSVEEVVARMEHGAKVRPDLYPMS